MKEKVNYYDLLNIKMDATEEDIKRAYRIQIKKWHPDINKDPQASEITSKLNEAKEILLNETKRRDYDESLKHPQKDAYENLNRRQSQRTKSSDNQSTTSGYTETSNQGYEEVQEETKTYTKWQYFKMYLKYYNEPTLRKILAFVLVILETIFCFLLEAINIIIAYIIIYTYEILQQALMIVGCILFILLVIFIARNDPGLTTFKIFLLSFGGVVSLLMSVMLPLIVRILLQKNPIYISRLNMFLFKKSIGYK